MTSMRSRTSVLACCLGNGVRETRPVHTSSRVVVKSLAFGQRRGVASPSSLKGLGSNKTFMLPFFFYPLFPVWWQGGARADGAWLQ